MGKELTDRAEEWIGLGREWTVGAEEWIGERGQGLRRSGGYGPGPGERV
jgi:hypothetical protein